MRSTSRVRWRRLSLVRAQHLCQIWRAVNGIGKHRTRTSRTSLWGYQPRKVSSNCHRRQGKTAKCRIARSCYHHLSGSKSFSKNPRWSSSHVHQTSLLSKVTNNHCQRNSTIPQRNSWSLVGETRPSSSDKYRRTRRRA